MLSRSVSLAAKQRFEARQLARSHRHPVLFQPTIGESDKGLSRSETSRGLADLKERTYPAFHARELSRVSLLDSISGGGYP